MAFKGGNDVKLLQKWTGNLLHGGQNSIVLTPIQAFIKKKI